MAYFSLLIVLLMGILQGFLLTNISAQNFHSQFSNDSTSLSDDVKKILNDPCLLPYKNKKILLPESLFKYMNMDLKNEDFNENWTPRKLDYWYVYHWTNDEYLIKKILKVKNNSKKKIMLLKEFMIEKKYDFGADLALPSLYVSHDFYSSSGYGKYLLKLKIQAPKDNHLLYMDYDELIKKFSRDMAEVNQDSCEMAESRKKTTKALWLMAFEDNEIDYFIYSGKKNDHNGYAQIINENIVEAVDAYSFQKNTDYLLDKNTGNQDIEDFIFSMSEEEILYYLSVKASHFQWAFLVRLEFKNLIGSGHSNKGYNKFLQKLEKVLISLDNQNLSPECIVLKNNLINKEKVEKNKTSSENLKNDFYKTHFSKSGLCSQILNFNNQ